MGKSLSSSSSVNDIIEASTMPCYACDYAHRCKYYNSTIWDIWIMNNKECPAFTYTYDSIFRAIGAQREEEERKAHQYNSPLPKKSSKKKK